MPSTDRSAAQAVNAYIRARAEGCTSGPFALLLSPGTADTYANYAVPDDGAAPTEADAAALIAAFLDRGRVPRLEYAPAAAPAVDLALRAAGFAEEARPPLLTLTAADPLDAPLLDEIAIRLARPDDLAAACDTLAEAFGSPVDPDHHAHASMILAQVEGQVVGVGSLQTIAAATSEIAGIGVRPAWRRRGIAQALTVALAREGFARGAETLFLSAADDAAAGIYARAGFVRRAPMLFLIHPG